MRDVDYKIKNHDAPLGAPANSGRAVIRVLLLTLLLNILNFSLKIVVAMLTGSLAVLSDAFHGVMDAANNIVGMVVLREAWRPPDKEHPYGHRKLEAVASLGIGLLMGLISWEIIQSIFSRLTGGQAGIHNSVKAIPVGLMLFGIALNLSIAIYEQRRGRALKSQFLVADAMHTRMDVLVTLLALGSLLLAWRWPWLDTIFSMVIVGMILRAGWLIVLENAQLLTDTVQVDPAPIQEVVEEIDGVKDVHTIRSHGLPDDVHLDMHIVVDPQITAEESADIEERIRAALKDRYPGVHEVQIKLQTRRSEAA